MIVVQGSCINFDEERPKILEFIGSLECSVHSTGECECSSTGKALGWEFFSIYFSPNFVEKLLDVYPEIQKEEGNDLEQRFVLWLASQMKKSKLQYYLKLSDVPREQTKGFRLNPDAYRDDNEMEKLR